jgi:hypothetical protein
MRRCLPRGKANTQPYAARCPGVKTVSFAVTWGSVDYDDQLGLSDWLLGLDSMVSVQRSQP